MPEMDRPTASLIVRMHMRLSDEGTGPYDDHLISDAERRADRDIVTVAARTLLDTPADGWTPQEWEVEEYGLLSGRPRERGDDQDEESSGPAPARFAFSTMRVTGHGAGRPVEVHDFGYMVGLELLPILGPDEHPIMIGCDVTLGVPVRAGELGASREALAPAVAAFAAMRSGTFTLEAWASLPAGGWVQVTVHSVSVDAEGLLQYVDVLGHDEDYHLVKFFQGRASSVPDGRCAKVWTMAVTQDEPPTSVRAGA